MLCSFGPSTFSCISERRLPLTSHWKNHSEPLAGTRVQSYRYKRSPVRRLCMQTLFDCHSGERILCRTTDLGDACSIRPLRSLFWSTRWNLRNHLDRTGDTAGRKILSTLQLAQHRRRQSPGESAPFCQGCKYRMQGRTTLWAGFHDRRKDRTCVDDIAEIDRSRSAQSTCGWSPPAARRDR
jgi:hypothetical protein